MSFALVYDELLKMVCTCNSIAYRLYNRQASFMHTILAVQNKL